MNTDDNKMSQSLISHLVNDNGIELNDINQLKVIINDLTADIIKLHIEKERIFTECERKHAEYLQSLIDEQKLKEKQKRLRKEAAAESARHDKINDDNRKAAMAEKKRQHEAEEAEKQRQTKFKEEEIKKKIELKKQNIIIIKDICQVAGIAIGAIVAYYKWKESQ